MKDGSIGRDLVRTCFLDRQIPMNLLLGQAKISMEKLPFLTQ